MQPGQRLSLAAGYKLQVRPEAYSLQLVAALRR
jgi:hypothetical protein